MEVQLKGQNGFSEDSTAVRSNRVTLFKTECASAAGAGDHCHGENVTKCILKPFRRGINMEDATRNLLSVASQPLKRARMRFLSETLGAPMKSVAFPDLNTTRLTEPMLEHEVRLRAYERYQRRGRVDGHALEDWLQAEAEVLQRLSYRTY